MTPIQCRAARALIDWSQQQLADASGVGIVTIRQFEAGAVAPRNATTEAMMNALEKVGVEFLVGNGGGEGARLRAPSFTQVEFLAFLRLYNQSLQKKARHNKKTNLPVFGYALVYHNREGADLMYRGKRLGLVRWHSSEIIFDPPLPKGEAPSLSDDSFNKWLAQAELRDAIGG
jgi:transcriptional regulator with XRE-family HTH domain